MDCNVGKDYSQILDITGWGLDHQTMLLALQHTP